MLVDGTEHLDPPILSFIETNSIWTFFDFLGLLSLERSNALRSTSHSVSSSVFPPPKLPAVIWSSSSGAADSRTEGSAVWTRIGSVEPPVNTGPMVDVTTSGDLEIFEERFQADGAASCLHISREGIRCHGDVLDCCKDLVELAHFTFFVQQCLVLWICEFGVLPTPKLRFLALLTVRC